MEKSQPTDAGPNVSNWLGLSRAALDEWPTHLVRFLLFAIVAVTPWLFGSVQPRIVAILMIATAAAVALALVCQHSSLNGFVPAVTYPLLAAIGLALLQLAPLPASVARRLSPQTVELRQQLDVLPDVEPGGTLEKTGSAETVTLSVYPAATKLNLALLVLATAACLLGSRFLSDERCLHHFCVLLTAGGAALSLFGIVQQLTWNGKLFWVTPITQGGIPFGPFVNRNNAAGYLNLCLAGALVCFVRGVIARGGKGGEHDSTDFEDDQRDSYLSPRERIVEFMASLNGAKLSVITAIILIMAGILCSLSRGGSLAMAAALIATCVVLWRKGYGRGIVPLALTLLAVAAGLLLWVGRAAAVQQRLGTLLQADLMQEGRVPHWRIAFKAVADAPWLGSGLGTYKFVYPRYDEVAASGMFYHAENQFIEALVEGGVLGLTLLALAICLMFWSIWRLCTAQENGQVAAAMLGLFALTSQVVASCFDFGLYTPATMILLALICGAVAGRSAQMQIASSIQEPAISRPRKLLPLLLALLLVGTVNGFSEFFNRASVEEAITTSRRLKFDVKTDNKSLHDVATALERALQNRWDDAEAHQELARVLMQQYRLDVYNQLSRQYANQASAEAIWNLASPVYLHRRVNELAAGGNVAEVQALRQQPAVIRHLTPAYDHLLAARRACLLLAEVHLDLGEISAVLTEQGLDAEAVYLEHARQVAPASPNIMYRAGLLDLDAHRVEPACHSWCRSLELSPIHLEDILKSVSGRLSPEKAASEVLPVTLPVLRGIVQRPASDVESSQIRDLFLARALSELSPSASTADESHYWRGLIHAQQGKLDSAVTEYEQAVKLRPAELQWRHELALLYIQRKDWDKAREQVVRCIQMAPQRQDFQTLLQQIHRARLGR